MKIADEIATRADEIAEYLYGIGFIDELPESIWLDCLTQAEDELLPEPPD